MNTTIWFILFILSVSLAGITYISLKVSTETHLFTTELPTSREFHGIVKIKESLKKNPNYPNTLFIAQFIEESSNNRLKDNERIFISVRTDAFSDELFSIGNTISLRGLHSYITRNNTNRFGNTLRQKNVYSKITHVKSAQLVHLSEETFIHQLRSQFIHTLELGAPKNKDFEGIYKAMLIGQKQDLSEKQKKLYIQTGTMHLFAVSGLHIGIITLFILQFLKLIRLPETVLPIITLSTIFVFILIIGSPPSALRAFLMITIYWLSFIAHRQPNPFSALILSAILLLIINPWQLLSEGFKLSYSVVGTLLLLGLPLNDWLQSKCQLFKWLPKDNWTTTHKAISCSVKSLILATTISFAAWIGSIAICFKLFGYVSSGAILANVVLIQIASLAILTGIVSLGVSFLNLTSVSEFLNHSAWLIISAMNDLLMIVQKLPFPALEKQSNEEFPSDWIQVAFWCLLIFSYHMNSKKHLSGLLIPVIILLVSILIIAQNA